MIQLGSLFYRGDLKHVLVFALLESFVLVQRTRHVKQQTKQQTKKVASKGILI